MSLGPVTAAVADATKEAMDAIPRLWARDHRLWQDDPTEVADRLGWLDAAARASELVPRIERLVVDVGADGITDVLLVGMGGSSLYPEVLATTFGPAAGSPRLRVLDSTDPGAVLAVERELPWSATLLVPASKSGTTIEMDCHLDRFFARLVDAHGAGSAGRFVVPITDPGSQLAAKAHDRSFRDVVYGDPDVGGRFSALTAFGLFPAALLGIDVDDHLAAARVQLEAARSTDPGVNGPAVLGATLAAAVRHGRDKLTVLLPDEVASFGVWVEQLVAESTGKNGVGILPVLGDDPKPTGRGSDRLTVALGDHPALGDLAAAGQPVVALPWDGPRQLAGEVVRWEVATAVAGALLGINPFDQPDVAAAKAATTHALESGQDLPPLEDPAAALASVAPSGYIAILGFVTPGSDDEQRLRRVADRFRKQLPVPVTVGIGPRYLHSTGQLHKGGPPGGVFLVVVGADPEDADIPGRPYGFSRLKRAQATGDLTALRTAGRTAAHVTLEALEAL